MQHHLVRPAGVQVPGDPGGHTTAHAGLVETIARLVEGEQVRPKPGQRLHQLRREPERLWREPPRCALTGQPRRPLDTK